MIITLKGADFSKNNIGPLSSWLISREIGDGARYSGPVYVSKGGAFSATVILASGYRLNGEVVVTMGETIVSNAFTVSEDGKTINFTIAEVTGNVHINVPTEYVQIYHTITYLFLDENGVAIKDPETAQALEGTQLVFDTANAPEIEGYIAESVEPASITIQSDVTITYNYYARIVFYDSDFEVGAWTAAGAPVVLDSRFRTKTPKQFNRDVTFTAVTLPNTAGPTSLRIISNGAQTDWITDSYTVPANTEFHLILAKYNQTGSVENTKTVVVPTGATKLYLNSLKDQKHNAFVTINGITYSGEDFLDGRYYYGTEGEAMSTLNTSSKAAACETPYAVTAGESITIRTFTNGTVGYVFTDDSGKVLKIGASTEFAASYYAPTEYFTYE